MAREQWLVSGPKTIDIQTVREVRANLARGAVSLIADEGPGARVEVASVNGRELKVAIEGDALVIDHPQLTVHDLAESARALVDGPEAVVSIRVPASAPVKVRTVEAEILVSGVRAAVAAASVNGDIFLDGVHGHARVTTSRGEIAVRGHEGAVTARTISGDMVLAGAIDVADVLSTTGQTILDIERVLPDSVIFQSVTGAITIRLPQDATPSYLINAVRGRIELDGQRVRTSLGTPWRSPAPEHTAELTDIRLTTVAGRIAIVRGADTRSQERPDLQSRTPVSELDAGLDQSMDARVRDARDQMDGAQPGSPAGEPAPFQDAGQGFPDTADAGAPADVLGRTDPPGQPSADDEGRPGPDAFPASDEGDHR